MVHLSDEAAIADLLARVAIATDEGTLEEYAACFAPDAELVTDPRLAVPGREVLRGSDEILQAIADRRAGGSGPGSGTRHVVTNVAVRVNGDQAESTAYWMFFRVADANPVVVAIGQYRDRFRRDDGVWRLTYRKIVQEPS